MTILCCLPKLETCFVYIKDLRFACILIALWGMITATHSCKMLIWPLNDHHKHGEFIQDLYRTKLMLLMMNIAVIVGSFAFLLSLCLMQYVCSVLVGYLTIAILYTGCTLLYVLVGIRDLVYKNESLIDCNNFCYILGHIIHFVGWCYFILILNSFSEEIDENNEDVEYN